MKNTIYIFFASLIVSCTSYKTIAPIIKVYDLPEAGTTKTAELGETLIQKGKEYVQDAYKITSMPSKPISINLAAFPYTVGDVLPLVADYGDWQLYYKNGIVTGYTTGLAKHKKNGWIRPFVWSGGGFASKANSGLTAEKSTYSGIDCQDCLKQELVYNGRVANNLKFIYREYVNNMARPSFTQELQYDLSESNTIGFKGARLEIEKATNTSITYKVLSSFTKV